MTGDFPFLAQWRWPHSTFKSSHWIGFQQVYARPPPKGKDEAWQGTWCWKADDTLVPAYLKDFLLQDSHPSNSSTCLRWEEQTILKIKNEQPVRQGNTCYLPAAKFDVALGTHCWISGRLNAETSDFLKRMVSLFFFLFASEKTKRKTNTQKSQTWICCKKTENCMRDFIALPFGLSGLKWAPSFLRRFP